MLDYKLVTILEGMIIIQEAVISFFEKLKSASRLYKLIALAAISVILVLLSVFSSGIKLTYNLIYDGNVFANVSSKSVYNEAVELASAQLADSNSVLDNLEIKSVVTINGKFSSAKEASQLILQNNPGVCNGFEVRVDDTVVGYVSTFEEFETLKNNRLNAFNIEGATCTSSFSASVTANNAFFSSKNLSKQSDIEAAFAKLDVQTVAITDTTYSVKYETTVKKDSSKKAGYEKVLTQGSNGTNRTVKEVTYLNGQAVSEPKVSTTVVKAPVTEVVVVGTKNVYVTSAPQNAASSGFKWPLGVKGVITGEYNERRSSGKYHAGVDIGVPVGTSVIAVKSGTVEAVGYDSDYGYYVLIDHGNGLKTRYAHNKTNTVSKGQTVSAGQLIALSGNSGRSTGPHLHFEVIVNGTRTNPGYSINLK